MARSRRYADARTWGFFVGLQDPSPGKDSLFAPRAMRAIFVTRVCRTLCNAAEGGEGQTDVAAVISRQEGVGVRMRW